jgi:hypothetical protein
MSIPGIVGQSVLTQATTRFVQITAGLRGRLISVFQNRSIAAATLCVTVLVLISAINKVCPKIFESKLVKNFSARVFEKRSEKYDSCRHGIAWMSASIIMIVGTLALSKLLQLPFSRGTTLAVAGWTLFSHVIYVAYLKIDRDHSDDSDDEEIHYAVKAPSDSYVETRSYSDSESDSDDDDGVTEPPRRREPPTVQPTVNEGFITNLLGRLNTTEHSSGVTG